MDDQINNNPNSEQVPPSVSGQIPQIPSKQDSKNWKLLAVIFSGLFFITLIVCIFAVLKLKISKPDNENFVPTPTAILPTPTIDPTTDWQVVKREFLEAAYEINFSYEIKYPNTWKEIEHSSNFYYTDSFQAPDQSQIQIFVANNKFTNLDDYLEEIDKESSTGWEGAPSKKILESKKIKLNSLYDAIERKEEWLAAGFTATVTYVAIGDTVYSIAAIPNGDNSANNEAFDKYQQVLSTFKNNKELPSSS